MNFVEGNDRRKALSSISSVLDCTHKNVYIVSVWNIKNIQSYDFIVCNPKWTQMQYCVGAKWTVCHRESWGHSVQQHRRCEAVSRKAGHSFLAVHRPLISWHSDVNSCPQDFCPPTGRGDKCPTSPFVCTFGHESIKGLIAQLPYSTCPLDILLQLHVFIPPQPLVHRRAPSGPTSQSQVDTPSTAGRQQIKRLIHGHYHHKQKKDSGCHEKLTSWHLQLSLPPNAGVSCQLLYTSKRGQEKKGGSSVSHSEEIYDRKAWTEYRCWNEKAWQSCPFLTS